jgi:hypothetical protein
MEKTVRSYIMCTAHKYYWGGQTRRMIRAGSVVGMGRQKKCIQNFGGDV